MKLITEYNESDVQCIVEKKEDGSKKYLIEGVFAMAESKNRNGRIYPKAILEKAFNRKFSEKFNIHRTRKGFDNDGIDSFENMALKGLKVVDLVVSNKMNGLVYEDKWIIPKK